MNKAIWTKTHILITQKLTKYVIKLIDGSINLYSKPVL